MEAEAFKTPHQTQISELVAYVVVRRETLLNTWRTTCAADPTLHSASGLSREEFNNELPVILNILEQRLRKEPEEGNPIEMATQHGLNRWHKGYRLQEVITEVNYLRAGVFAELSTFRKLYPQIENDVLAEAYEVTAHLFGEVTQGSVMKYDELQGMEATSRGYSLQEALDAVNEVERKRDEFLRMSSHDLRGGLGIVQSAAFMMDLPGTTEEDRTEMSLVLQRNLLKVRNLLTQLSDLSHLQAGQETLDIAPFDAGELLTGIVESAQVLATQKQLILQGDGPKQLLVESDAIKVQRIVQNLLLNAIHYTPKGYISVSWSEENTSRWIVSVQDSGGGLPAGPATLLAAQLRPMADSAELYPPPHHNEPQSTPSGPSSAAPLSTEHVGEGLGLHIVKRLCEVLNANMDVEIKPGEGTLFRIRFRQHHQ